MDAIGLLGVYFPFPQQIAAGHSTGHGKAVGGRRQMIRAMLAEQMHRSLLDSQASRSRQAEVVQRRIAVARTFREAQEMVNRREVGRAVWVALLSEV